MIEAEGLLRWLNARPAASASEVVGWRLDLARSGAIRAGLRASRLGGPYETPGFATRLGGSLDLHWSDGRLTRARLTRAEIRDPERALPGWLAEASSSEPLPALAGPASLPDVAVFDPDLARAVSEDPRRLLTLLRPDSDAGGLAQGRRLDTSLRASAGRRLVVTSAGFRHAWDETALVLDVWIDDAAGATFASRRLPTAAALATLVGDAASLASSLQRDITPPHPLHGALFMPAAVEAALDQFLPPALSARAIRDGRSAFSWDDLVHHRAILAEHVDLLVDTTVPFGIGTAPCSPDGVPAGRAALVQAGRLVSPLVDLALSRELGLPPTPTPRGAPRFLVQSSAPTASLASALNTLGDGVIVRNLPGLHAQRRGRWSYALVVPDAQAVVGGAVAGRCAVRVGGSLLEQLRSPATRLVSVPGQWNPGLLVLDGIRIEPA